MPIDWGKLKLQEITSPAGVTYWSLRLKAAMSAGEVIGLSTNIAGAAQLPVASSAGSVNVRFYDEQHTQRVHETAPSGQPVAVNEHWWQANITGVKYEAFLASSKTFATSTSLMLGLLLPRPPVQAVRSE
jgi:hypothetical protein